MARGSRPVALTPKEYALLRRLMEHPGAVPSRSQILSAIWGHGFDPGTRVVDVHIRYLRAKVDGGGEQPLIHTVRGFGHCIGLLAPLAIGRDSTEP